MKPIYYIDRQTHEKCQEQVYGAKGIQLLYGDTLISKLVGAPTAYSLARLPFFSALYGYFQKTARSAQKIIPFIRTFKIDINEFADEPKTFRSFNDFFIRKLKSTARPLASDPLAAIIPADGRYLFYQHLDQVDGFIVKGEKFDLATLLGDVELAHEYATGSMVIARLCPTDYHRYHIPCNCMPTESKLINGWLYSVNPAALSKNIHIFTQNKRTLCCLASETFGRILYLEIGATFVGAIHQTYTAGREQIKGDEKGYFSFGASSLILLFQKNAIQFDQDLLDATAQGLEIKCLMGQQMGLAKQPKA